MLIPLFSPPELPYLVAQSSSANLRCTPSRCSPRPIKGSPGTIPLTSPHPIPLLARAALSHSPPKSAIEVCRLCDLPPSIVPSSTMLRHHIIHRWLRRPAFYLVRPLQSPEDRRSSFAAINLISLLPSSSPPATPLLPFVVNERTRFSALYFLLVRSPDVAMARNTGDQIARAPPSRRSEVAATCSPRQCLAHVSAYVAACTSGDVSPATVLQTQSTLDHCLLVDLVGPHVSN